MIKNPDLIERLTEGNRRFLAAEQSLGDVSPAVRRHTAEHGQAPYAIVVAAVQSSHSVVSSSL